MSRGVIHVHIFGVHFIGSSIVSVTLTFLLPINVRVEQLSRVLHAAYRVRVRRVQRAHLAPRRQQLARHLRVLLRQPHLHLYTHSALSTDTLTDRPYSAPPAARATPARAPAPAAPPSVHTLSAQHRHTHRPSLQRAASSSRDTCACSCASRTSICTHTQRSAQTHSQTVPTARRQQLARHLRVLLLPAAPPSVQHTQRSAQTHSQTVPTARRQQLARHLRVLLRQPHLHLYTHSALSTDTPHRPSPTARRQQLARHLRVLLPPAAPPSVHTLSAQHRHTHRPSLQRAASSSRDTCACSCASRTSICTHTQRSAQTHSQTVPTARRQQLARHLRVLCASRTPSSHTQRSAQTSQRPTRAAAARATPRGSCAAHPTVHNQRQHRPLTDVPTRAPAARATLRVLRASRPPSVHTLSVSQTHHRRPTARRRLARHLRVLAQPHLHCNTLSAQHRHLTDVLRAPQQLARTARALRQPHSSYTHQLRQTHSQTVPSPSSSRDTCACSCASRTSICTHTQRSAQTHSQTVPTARRQQLARHLRVLLRQPHLHLYTHSALSTDTLTDRPYSAPPAARATPARAPAPAAPPSVHTLSAQHRHTHRPSLQRAASSSRDTCACSCASRTSICTHTQRSAQTHSQTVPTARRQQLARHLRVLLRQPHLHLYTHSALSTDTLTDRPYSAPPAARATPARAPAPAAPPSVHTLSAQHRHTHRPSLQRAASSSRDTCACSCASRTSICTHTQRSAQTHSQTVPTARRQQLARHLRVLLRQPHLHLYTHSALSTDTLTDRPYSAPPAARATPARAPAPAAPPSVHTLSAQHRHTHRPSLQRAASSSRDTCACSCASRTSICTHTQRSAQTHSQTVPTARRQQLARHLRVLLRQPHLHLYTHSALSTDTLTDRPYSAPPAARATPARAPAPAAPPSVHTLSAQHRHTHRPSLQRAASSSRDTCACSCASRTSICTHTQRSAQTHSQTVPTARRQQLARHLRVLLRQPHLHLYTHSALSTDTLTDRPYSAPPAARATPARAPAPAAPPSVHTLSAQHRHTHRPSLQRAASSSRDTCACSCASRTSICTHTQRSAQTHSQTVPTARRQQLARHLRVLLRQPHLHLYTHSALSTDTLTDRPYSAPPAARATPARAPAPAAPPSVHTLSAQHRHTHRPSLQRAASSSRDTCACSCASRTSICTHTQRSAQTHSQTVPTARRQQLARHLRVLLRQPHLHLYTHSALSTDTLTDRPYSAPPAARATPARAPAPAAPPSVHTLSAQHRHTHRPSLQRAASSSRDTCACSCASRTSICTHTQRSAQTHSQTVPTARRQQHARTPARAPAPAAPPSVHTLSAQHRHTHRPSLQRAASSSRDTCACSCASRTSICTHTQRSAQTHSQTVPTARRQQLARHLRVLLRQPHLHLYTHSALSTDTLTDRPYSAPPALSFSFFKRPMPREACTNVLNDRHDADHHRHRRSVIPSEQNSQIIDTRFYQPYL
ncbi:unnamed protein product [Arctia plantaginis]|uniref:Uncharacterized protein n=1 Tax=Arctia plantaginis TaxID=874455 RepID=A0A8S1A7N3_ARCPL|nr:unnamed protein product [Arctia plantaginis]